MKGPTYIAEWTGPPCRKMWIYYDPETPRRGRRPAPGSSPLRGWMFVVNEMDSDGEMQPLWDVWDERFADIIQYPLLYAPKSVEWRDEKTGLVVDIYSGMHS